MWRLNAMMLFLGGWMIAQPQPRLTLRITVQEKESGKEICVLNCCSGGEKLCWKVLMAALPSFSDYRVAIHRWIIRSDEKKVRKIIIQDQDQLHSIYRNKPKDVKIDYYVTWGVETEDCSASPLSLEAKPEYSEELRKTVEEAEKQMREAYITYEEAQQALKKMEKRDTYEEPDTFIEKIEELLGDQKSGSLEMEVRPNPTSGIIQVTVPEGGRIGVRVYTIKGYVVHEGEYKGPTFTLDLSDKGEKIYIIHMQGEKFYKVIVLIE
ncbi:MAG: hypothetical protein RMK19_03755 [Bacteroidia bacterium]|nr:hypothetical protein [Bacteroidia bacterium]MDW8015106.1 hypothetical protein [Bacteroidia bacterium]